MEAVTPAIRKLWCMLRVFCNTRIAAASGPRALGPAVIHRGTGLSFFAPAHALVTWDWQCTSPTMYSRVLPLSSSSRGDPDCSVCRTKSGFCKFELFLSLLILPASVCLGNSITIIAYIYTPVGGKHYSSGSVLEEDDRGRKEIGRRFTYKWQPPGGCMFILVSTPPEGKKKKKSKKQFWGNRNYFWHSKSLEA